MKHKDRSIFSRYLMVFTLFILLIGFIMLSLVQPAGLEQQKEVEKWTIETHDRTNFPLTGRHRLVSCRECHLNNVFEGTPAECEVCHWERRQDDRYELNLGTHCSDCHTTFSWKNVPPNKWNHTAAVGFALEGIHRTLDCIECHKDLDFVSATKDCIICHERDYRETKEPNHAAAGFPQNCQFCHSSTSRWEGAKIIHDRFFLTGKHKTARCQECHSSGVYGGLPSDCVACHLDDYNQAEDPNHKELNFPTDCELCHGTSAVSWENANFAHLLFPLKGQHRITPCTDCHTNSLYTGTPSDCASCHLEDYNGARDPDHKELNFPTDCEQCHGTNANSWEGATFNHNLAWPLQGAHTKLDCSSCHDRGYDLPQECYGCHAQDYNSARNPNHNSANFPTDCEICHFPTHTYWSQAVFDHQFPIETGKHNGLSCTDCHISTNYKLFSCIDCHAHEKTKMDNEHSDVSGYSYDSPSCYACHPQGRE